MSKIIGLSRNINLEWLDKVAELYILDKVEGEIKDELNEYLSFVIKSPTNLRKTREILMNIWVKSIGDLSYAKDLAKKLYLSKAKENRLLAHYCLMLLTYPVFVDICATIGKMERNMFDISNKNISNRMFDLWGERSTLFHSIAKNLRTLKDMDILYTIPKNIYKVKKHTVDDKDATILIAYTILSLKNNLYMSIEELNNNPKMFPFEYNITIETLNDNDIFLIDKFGGELVVSKR